MSVHLEVLGARVLVHPEASPEKIGSLYVPQMHREYAIKGKVLAIGPEVRDIEVGMTVVFPALSGQAVGENTLIQESSVLGTV